LGKLIVKINGYKPLAEVAGRIRLTRHCEARSSLFVKIVCMHIVILFLHFAGLPPILPPSLVIKPDWNGILFGAICAKKIQCKAGLP
jgi:hypothetical protein